MVKAIWIAVLTAAWLIPGSVRAQTDEGLATAESRVLAAYMEAEFGPFIRDYIHVFLGYQACAYSFVDEEAYNKLADQQLLKMSQRAQELIAQSATAAELSPLARQYAARLAVLTAMELHSNAITAELSPLYGSGEADCALSAEQNLPRYRALQAYASP